METFHRLTLSDLLSLYWDWIPALSLRPVQLLSSRTHKMRLFLSRNERYRTNRTQELSNYDLWFPPPSLMLTNEIRPLPKVSERRVCLFYPLYIEDVRGWRYSTPLCVWRFFILAERSKMSGRVTDVAQVRAVKNDCLKELTALTLGSGDES